jgi:L-ascorbate metabolism protein UlaG (beta-lactamase superfamily)
MRYYDHNLVSFFSVEASMLTLSELQAVQLANRFKQLISSIRALDNSQLQDTAAMSQFGAEFQDSLSIPTMQTLEIILTLTSANGAVEVTNFYYLYFLQQITRFNQFFNVIAKITDVKDPNAFIATSTILPERLMRANIKPLLHPLLAPPTTMSVVLKKRSKNTFREHYLDDDYRKYYNEKSTADGERHQDHDHYYKANLAIGSATQKSNLLGLFHSKYNQPRDDYFKPADAEKHKLEKKFFASAIKNIQTGKELSPDEINVLQNGDYYRYPLPQQFALPSQEISEDRITHLGHASELIHMQGQSNLMVAIDPVNYQSGTEGFIVKWGATIGYPRKTAAALATNDYPATQVVLLTHNHHDHMCIQSLTEAFSPKNTLFIVPLGDARRLRAQGFEHVVEFGSWNDYAEISLVNAQNQTSTYVISSFPAKHASNRFTNDLYVSLYMGFTLRHIEKDNLILCSGDTGVLDEEHFKQFETYLLHENLLLKKACIASGPDRPRQWMECTHQSTADAIIMHAKFNLMNFKVIAQSHGFESLAKLPPTMIEKGLVNAIGYHQGCFRLGLLSLQDVRTTILRMLSVLKTLSDNESIQVGVNTLDKNIFYHFMDHFEQKALLETIRCYQINFSLAQITQFITTSFFIPQPGRSWQAGGFTFDYERLIQNRNPLSISDQLINKPYEYFALQVKPDLYLNVNQESYKALIHGMFAAYLNRTLSMRSGKSKKLKAFLSKLDVMQNKNISEELGKLYADIFPKQDEGIRDEGHVHTMLTILAGLMHFPEFRGQFHARHEKLQTPALAVGIRL